MQISASQLETFGVYYTTKDQIVDKYLSSESCNRKWWFEKVVGLPTPPGKAQQFGSKLHEVLERYFLADDLGYLVDEDGKRIKDNGGKDRAIDLYPEGWDKGLEKVEADLIRRLIVLATQNGILERSRARKVEWGFSGQVIDKVTIIGFIDLLLEDTVIDHKSTSDFKYAKGEDKLSRTVQMLIYAKVLLELSRDKGQELQKVTLRHNQFLKNTEQPKVKKTQIDVSAKEIDDFWIAVQATAKDMLALKESTLLTDQMAWKKVKGPRNLGACNAYGGCPFMRICGGAETMDGYRKRIETITKRAEEKAAKEDSEKMGLMDKYKAAKTVEMRAETKAETKPPEAGALPDAQKVVETPATQPVVQQTIRIGGGIGGGIKITPMSTPPADPGFVALTPENPTVINGATKPPKVKKDLTGYIIPPWALADCNACEGTGVSSKGYPCPICNAVRAAKGEATDDAFQGKFEIKEGRIVRFDGLGSTPAPAPTSTESSTTAPPPPPTPSPLPDDGIDQPKKRRGRPPGSKSKPKTPPATTATEGSPDVLNVQDALDAPDAPDTVDEDSFILCLNCVPIGGRDLHSVFLKIGQELAAAKKVDSYFNINAFERRDALASKASQIAEGLSGAFFVSTDTPDLASFATALRPHATLVIEG